MCETFAYLSNYCEHFAKDLKHATLGYPKYWLVIILMSANEIQISDAVSLSNSKLGYLSSIAIYHHHTA